MTDGRDIPRWRGVNRNGAARTGQGVVGGDVAAFVQTCYSCGWRSLTVTRGDEEVGGIDRRTDNGRRVWWAVSGT